MAEILRPEDEDRSLDARDTRQNPDGVPSAEIAETAQSTRAQAEQTVTFRIHPWEKRALSETELERWLQVNVLDVGTLLDDGFFQDIRDQFAEVGRLYLKMIENPVILAQGALEIIKDFFYRIPKSLIANRTFGSKQEELGFRVAQALGISEVVGTATSAGTVECLHSVEITGKIANILGVILGNFIPCIVSFIASYMFLTRRRTDYSAGDSFHDAITMERDSIPAAVVLYSSQASLIAVLIEAGIDESIASRIVIAWGLLFYSGVMKVAANERLK